MPLLRAVLTEPDDIVALRRRTRLLCERLGVESLQCTRFCTALSERGQAVLAMGGGSMTIGVDAKARVLIGTAVGIALIAGERDDGGLLSRATAEAAGGLIVCPLPAGAQLDEASLHSAAAPLVVSGAHDDTLDEVLVQQRELLLALEERDQRERELRALTESLDKQRIALRRSNSDLERFAAAASHDLKAPLAVINTYALVLAKMHAGQPSAGFASEIQGAAERLGTMLEGLLAWSRVEAADADTVACADDVVREVISNLSPQLTGLDVCFAIEPLESAATARVHLLQIFQNLFVNAVKYRSEQPLVIRVASRVEHNTVFYSVQDNGKGIPPEHHSFIFELFKRLDRDETTPGTGVGLALVARLVERYGGRISVQSSLAEGSIFTFSLPLAQGASWS